eukprot:1135790-Pleurochrysis_carterae.AAC.1
MPNGAFLKHTTSAPPPLTPCPHTQQAGRCAAVPLLRATPRACPETVTVSLFDLASLLSPVPPRADGAAAHACAL